MTELKIINERPLSLAELKASISKMEKSKELTYRGEKTKEYLSNLPLLTAKEAEKFQKQLEELNIPRLKDRHFAKIIDILPKDIDSLRALLSGETITIKEEDLKRILDVIPQ